MQTLYDVLGALPSDDAEGLRTAFRKAVKGAHPDIHPDDPDAALKFRQIVRANDILIDNEQRAAYDHLLDIAQLEQDSASKHAIAAKVHKVASGVIALACVSVVTVGSYLLFLHMSAAVVPPANRMEAALRAWAAKIASARSAVSSETVGNSSSVNPESASPSAEAVASGAAMPEPDAGSAPVVNAGLTPDSNSLRVPGVFFSRNSDLNEAPAELEQTIDLDPASSPAYMDRDIVFSHLRRFDRVFADLARARRIQKESHSRSVSTMAGKPRLSQAAIPPSVTPLPRRRPNMRDPSREEVFTSAMR
jgi:curved DNA-binding protein CbpA